MTEQQQRELSAGLKALAGSTRGAGASPAVEQAVLREFAREHAARLPHRSAPGIQHAKAGSTTGSPERAGHAAREGGWLFPRFLPLAAALLLAVGTALWTARSSDRAPQAVHPADFVALPGAAALPEMESASIVRVSLPVAALPVYGVANLSDFHTESVEAELLVAQDGQARAIRLVHDITDSRSANNE